MPQPRFTVPAQDRIGNPATDTDPSSVQDWIAQLPYADLAGVARELTRALNLLNRHPDKVGDRGDIMAAYRTPCTRLIRTVPDRPGAPSSDQMRQLMTEMAYGYKHLINDTLAQHGWLQHRKRLSQALYFAAKYLSMEVFLGFEAYRCRTGNSWREMLAMYRLAEQQNLHHLAVEDRDQPNPQNATLSHVLKRIVLVKLQDPCHMMPGETRGCFDFLNELASEALLEDLTALRNPAGRYLLDLDGMESPKPPDPDTLPRNPDRFRYLNLLPISRTIQKRMRDGEADAATIPEALLRVPGLNPLVIMKRMLQSWHVQPERRNQREEAFGWMLCGYGLGAINHFLSAAPGDDYEEPDEEVELDAHGVVSHRTASYRRVRCRQVNRSAGGMCIRVHIPDNAPPKVGQVLMLQEEHSGAEVSWQAGIVQRLLRVDADTLEAGIQFIRGTVRPIALKVKGDTQSTAYQPAIWVDRGNPRLSSVLVNQGMYQRGREFVVKDGEPASVIRVDQLVEATPGFERFRFQLV